MRKIPPIAVSSVFVVDADDQMMSKPIICGNKLCQTDRGKNLWTGHFVIAINVIAINTPNVCFPVADRHECGALERLFPLGFSTSFDASAKMDQTIEACRHFAEHGSGRNFPFRVVPAEEFGVRSTHERCAIASFKFAERTSKTVASG